MRSRRFLLILAGTLLALVCAAAVLPARWLLAWQPEGVPLRVVEASGTLWRGELLLALGPAGARRTLPQRVTWQLGWGQDGPAIRLAHPWLSCQGMWSIGLSGSRVPACTVQLPANALGALGAPLNTLRPGGQLQLQWPAQTLPWTAPAAAGPMASLRWSQASSALSRLQPLGTYEAQFTHSGTGGMRLQVNTVNGALLLNLTGGWQARGGFHLQGDARPAPELDEMRREALQPLLTVLGRRVEDRTLIQIGRPTP